MEFEHKRLKGHFGKEFGLAWLEDDAILDKEIYRYLDMMSFLEIVMQKQLSVPLKGTFSDAYEGPSYTQMLYHFNRFIPVGEKDTAVYERLWAEGDKNFPLISSVPISCWTTSKQDNYFSWLAYKKSPLTVRIGTTVKKLIEALKLDCPFLVGPVKYSERIMGTPDILALFHKREAYQCENEIRFCFTGLLSGEASITDPKVRIELRETDWIDDILVGTLVNREFSIGFYHFLKETSYQSITRLSIIHEKPYGHEH